MESDLEQRDKQISSLTLELQGERQQLEHAKRHGKEEASAMEAIHQNKVKNLESELSEKRELTEQLKAKIESYIDEVAEKETQLKKEKRAQEASAEEH